MHSMQYTRYSETEGVWVTGLTNETGSKPSVPYDLELLSFITTPERPHEQN